MKKIISLIVSFIAVFVIGIFIGHSILPPHPLVAVKDRPIYPDDLYYWLKWLCVNDGYND
ncbi:hypothetical protein ICE98_03190 [Lactococcus lactis]|nr:hypothetical protein [Lactococcus lactis]